ncbi:MAG: hypothetical protein HC836_47375, partial [Richelia sp. RM2_1_2]|nr:hypothetical protein [Richelia sp. RM2_1_2]
GKEGLAKQGEFYNTMRELEKLAADNPELVQRLGIDPKKLEQQFIKLADEAAVAQKTSGKAAVEAGFERGGFGLRGVAEETLQRTLNLYGQKKRSMREYFNSPPESLTQDAAQLINSGVKHLSSLGEALQTAIGANDVNKRNAVLFAIMQQPKGRQILGLDSEE